MTRLMNIISSIITAFILNVEHLLMQSTLQTIHLLSERQRHLKEIMLLHLLNSSLPNKCLLDIGPILNLSREKNIWMKTRSNDWWTRIVNGYFKEEDWLEAFRMTKPTFEWLCDELRDELLPKENQIGTREPVSVEKQVAVCLYFLASCCEYRTVGYTFGIHKSTVWKCVHKVVDTINAKLMHRIIVMPDDDECENIAAAFQKKTNIPQLIGTIDGTHIPILPPSDGYRDFINRKGWPSIILQAVVDHKYKFRNIFSGIPGTSHDAAVLQKSNLYQNYKSLIPRKQKIILNVPIPYLIMGDPAYPLLPWLIKGYVKSSRLSPEEESFNAYLNSGRVCVEIAFGRLKARWRRLIKRIDLHYSYVPHIILACCILHNIVETRKEKFLQVWEHIVNESNTAMPQPQSLRAQNLDNLNAHMIRDTLSNYLANNFELRTIFYS